MFGEIHWRFEENMFGDLEKKCSAIWRKRVRRFGETRSAKTLEIWRNVVGAVMAILYWSLLWSSLELGDHKWRLNCNGEIMEKNYGDKNFIHHGAENTYLERFKDRNV